MDAEGELTRLVAAVGRAHEGDLDAVTGAFAEDAVFVDRPDEEPLEGLAAIEDHFAAFGGLRERFDVHEVIPGEGDRAAVRFALHYRADSDATTHLGSAWVTVADGRITRWDGMWVAVPGDPAT